MSIPETRGYLLGVNANNQFEIPHKLMNKIVENTGETALMIWLPHTKSMKILSVDTNTVIKVTAWFENMTQSIFDLELNPLLDNYKDALIYRTGVLFPAEINEKPSVEYYFTPSQEKRIENFEEAIGKIDGISSVEKKILERYTGD